MIMIYLQEYSISSNKKLKNYQEYSNIHPNSSFHLKNSLRYHQLSTKKMKKVSIDENQCIPTSLESISNLYINLLPIQIQAKQPNNRHHPQGIQQ